MNQETIEIGFKGQKLTYTPGEEISGAVRWELPSAPEEAEIRLCWFTRGKGTEDAEVVESSPLDAPQAGDMRTFSFTAPSSPYSFSGKLISLIWCVELVLQPKDRYERKEIIIAPDGKEVVLPHASAVS